MTLGALCATGKVQFAWLVTMTVVCLTMLIRERGMRRAGAGTLIIMYLVFIVMQLV